ncbi:hypothetical protein KAS79_00235 [Candidatus Parcubacteria bacterium]|nr:hypothetical protein [Candidatus Parcubacteria bacterium]
MNIFDLHFNPKAKEEILFDSFIYEPENEAEKRLGNLFIVGELGNALPQHSRFLNDLASLIKKEYYYSLQRSPEQSLKQALKKANEFLSQQTKKGDVSWLGNIQFTILAISPKSLSANSELNFAKIGKSKIFLLRSGQIFNIGKNLDSQEIEPYPLKVFGNIVSGKAIQNDKILILSAQVSEAFELEKITEEIAESTEPVKKILKNKEKIFKEISGICVLINLTSKTLLKEAITFEKDKESRLNFNFAFISKLSQKIKFPKIKIPGFKIPVFKTPEVKTPNLKFPTFPPIKEKLTLSFSKNKKKINRNLILVFGLIIVLALGFTLFKKEQEEKIKDFQNKIESVKEKTLQAESFLIIKNEKEANLLFQEALQEIIPLTEQKSSQKDEILGLKDSIEKQLEDLNKIKNIDQPELYSGDFPKQEKPSCPAGKEPPNDFKMDLACSFRSSLYFLDKQSGEIIRYPYLGNSQWGASQIWLKSSEKTTQAKSMTIDGSIWILTKDNQIDRYYIGSYKETLTLDFYPKLEKPSKIFTDSRSPELYILEPSKNRLIILSKTGEIIKQYQSDKFDDLKDFSISEDSKTIYLLNGSTVYQIQL